MNRTKKILIILGCIIAYCIPLIAIYNISQHEIKEYKIDTEDIFTEKAYGELISPVRSDVKECYKVSGEITSCTYQYIDLPCSSISSVNLCINEGDEVQCGEYIGNVRSVGIYSPCNGIFKEIIEGPKLQLKILTFNPLVLKINVNKDDADKFNCQLMDDNGIVYQVIEKSNQIVNGGLELVLSMTGMYSYSFGEKVEDVSLYTGREYTDVITIDKSCVYKKPGSDIQYVRICNEKGEFINEQQVEVGFEMGDIVCVSGIDENVYCDSGYKYVVNDEEIKNSTEVSNEVCDSMLIEQ